MKESTSFSVVLSLLQLHFWRRQCVSTTLPLSLRSGTRRDKSDTTAWHRCTTAVLRRPLLCMMSAAG